MAENNANGPSKKGGNEALNPNEAGAADAATDEPFQERDSVSTDRSSDTGSYVTKSGRKVKKSAKSGKNKSKMSKGTNPAALDPQRGASTAVFSAALTSAGAPSKFVTADAIAACAAAFANSATPQQMELIAQALPTSTGRKKKPSAADIKEAQS